MGVYYLAANYTKREYIQPDAMDQGAKLPEIVRFKFANVLTFLMANRSEWYGDEVKVIADSDREYDEVRTQFRDVSAEKLREYDTYEVEQRESQTSVSRPTPQGVREIARVLHSTAEMVELGPFPSDAFIVLSDPREEFQVFLCLWRSTGEKGNTTVVTVR